ncbi:hypothetical protein FRC17_010734 [Serendipita sp. 399]|nr:hypothetical protein FRC17_010734 [Serendipita sp. 399]
MLTGSMPSVELQLARILSVVFGVIGISAIIILLCILLHRRRMVITAGAEESTGVRVEQTVSADHDVRQSMGVMDLPNRLVNGLVKQSRASRARSMTLPIHSPPPALVHNRHSSAVNGRQEANPEVAYIPIVPPRRFRTTPSTPPGLYNETAINTSAPTTGIIVIHPPRTRRNLYPLVPPPTYAESMRFHATTRHHSPNQSHHVQH